MAFDRDAYEAEHRSALPSLRNEEFGEEGRPTKRLSIIHRNEIKAFCLSVVTDPAYRARIRAEAIAGTLSDKMEINLWERAYGKVQDKVAVLAGDPDDDLAAVSTTELAHRAMRIAQILMTGEADEKSEPSQAQTLSDRKVM